MDKMNYIISCFALPLRVWERHFPRSWQSFDTAVNVVFHTLTQYSYHALYAFPALLESHKSMSDWTENMLKARPFSVNFVYKFAEFHYCWKTGDPGAPLSYTSGQIKRKVEKNVFLNHTNPWVIKQRICWKPDPFQWILYKKIAEFCYCWKTGDTCAPPELHFGQG